MKKLRNILLAALVAIAATACNSAPKAKYVFLFIGDGMGFGCLSIAETYLSQAEEGQIGMGQLSFSDFPVLGAASTYSADHQTTDSAAGGTALASGTKTYNSSICIATSGDTIISIPYKLHDAGYKIGIMSTCGIDHATPGAFYGRADTRGKYYEIGSCMGPSGFEYFGGGDFIRPFEAEPSCYEKAESAGYTITYGREEYNAKKAGADKIVFFQKRDTSRNMSQLPTRLERLQRNKADDLTLAELVQCGIDKLYNDKGFFMMAEGSMIDWAAHSNDLPGMVFETLDFSDAIAVAKDFYRQHPKNTLIVITADHETGGPAGNKPDLAKVKEMFDPTAQGDVNADNYMDGEHNKADISKLAGVAWTTGSHTSDRVPVYAIGAGSEKFAGEIDNTEIPRKILEAMGINF